MTRNLNCYAPTHQVEIDRDRLPRGIIRGFAAPERGPYPCRLELVAGERVLSIADACGFSETARKKEVRFGWARFDIGGLSIAGALGEAVNLRCAVSGKLIETFSTNALASTSAQRPALSLLEYRNYIKELSGCSAVHQIAPFAERYRAWHGNQAFITASYEYLLKRPANSEETTDFLSSLPKDFAVMDCLSRITDSDEYKRHRDPVLPGVFSPGFPFGLELFG